MNEEPALVFFVPGEPVPQGSKKAWLNKKTGRVMMTEDQGTRHTTWRLKVTDAASAAQEAAGLTEPITVPVSVALTFRFKRNLGHYGTGRNAHVLKPGAPEYPSKPPDVDKLVRAVLDGITDAKVWSDDSLVVSVLARKRWVDLYDGTPEGCVVAIGPMPVAARAEKPEQQGLGL